MEFTIEQLNSGRKAILKNVDRLMADALILLESGRWPSAYFFCRVAIEESAKYYLLFDGLIDTCLGEFESRGFFKSFYSHKSKSAIIFKLARGSYPDSPQFQKGSEEITSSVAWLEFLKSLAIYCDFIKGVFTSPIAAITEKDARNAFEVATGLKETCDRFENETVGKTDWSSQSAVFLRALKRARAEYR